MSTNQVSAGDRASGHGADADGSRPGLLLLGTLGVVYGDIGTSSIYALREAVRAASGDRVPGENEIIGALSIIVWALTIIVTVKYALIVLRADNNGEGGTLSIMALARAAAEKRSKLILVLGMIGAALFFGDAVITPSISVLSAVEGFKVATPFIGDYTVAIAVVILVTLFSVQRFGTHKVSTVFGPIMLLWFLVLGFSGSSHLLDDPSVFRAINPLEAITFARDHSAIALAVAGAAFLAVTGAEALYVDLGHFGRGPIMKTWFALVFPCLILNYFGQGAYLLKSGGPVGQPLFEMMPGWALLPMVLLATAATIIASQAVISGAFSLSRQAIQLQLLPRLDIAHTSASQAGQIYLPQVNWLMLIGVLLLVVLFGSSEAIASAYGISVAGEMLVTTLLLLIVMRGVWKWSFTATLLVILPFLLLDVLFLSANTLKFLEGGWVSILIAAGLLLVMQTWRKGSAILFQKTRRQEIPLETLTKSLTRSQPHIVPGTAVFLTSDPASAPTSLLHSLKHYKVMHERNIIATVKTRPLPRVDESERIVIEPCGERFFRVTLNFGFMEDVNVPQALRAGAKKGLKLDIMSTSFFLSRRSLRAARFSGMPMWQDRLYILLARNAADATNYFHLPTGRVVEIGTQVVI